MRACAGMAGQDWQPPWAPLYGFIYPIPDWSLFRQDGYGYARLQADRHTLTLTYITSERRRAGRTRAPLLSAAVSAGVRDASGCVCDKVVVAKKCRRLWGGC